MVSLGLADENLEILRWARRLGWVELEKFLNLDF